MIVLLFILGTGSAAAHHFYYSTLHDTAAGGGSRQQWVIQIGTGLAFLSRSTLASVIGISRTQWIWTTLRKRFISVAGIDALFGVTLDPTYFTNLDMIRRAKLATLMAVFIWILPITAILTPGTISVRNVARVGDVPCLVRMLVFEFDPDSKAQKLCCDDTNIQYISIGAYAGQVLASKVYVERVLRLALLSGHAQIPTNIGQYDSQLSAHISQRPETTLSQHCGRNCSYSITFLAPGVECIENTIWGSRGHPWKSALAYMNGAYFRAVPVDGVLWAGHFMEGEEPLVLNCRRTVSRYRVTNHLLDYQFLEPIIEAVETVDTLPDAQSVYPDTIYLPNDVLLDIIASEVIRNLSRNSNFSNSDISLTPLNNVLIEQP